VRLHPASRVKLHKEMRTRAYRFSRQSGLPCAMVTAITPLLGDEFLFVPSQRIRLIKPGWADFTSAGLTSATDAGTTRLPYLYAVSCVPVVRSPNSIKSRLLHDCAPELPRPPHPPRVSDDHDTPS